MSLMTLYLYSDTDVWVDYEEMFISLFLKKTQPKSSLGVFVIRKCMIYNRFEVEYKDASFIKDSHLICIIMRFTHHDVG